MANQMILRHVERQQVHIYRQIAAEALAECDSLKNALEAE